MAGMFGLSALLRRRRMLMNTLGLSKTIPQAMRPSVVIQRKAIADGLLGPSVFWKVVAVAMFLRGPVEGTFGRRSERIARYRVRPGHSVKVTTFEPTTRKQRKELGLTKAKAYEKAWAEIQDPNFRP
jgi:hypothetical protein